MKWNFNIEKILFCLQPFIFTECILSQIKYLHLPYRCKSQKTLHILEVLTSYNLVSLALKRHPELWINFQIQKSSYVFSSSGDPLNTQLSVLCITAILGRTRIRVNQAFIISPSFLKVSLSTIIIIYFAVKTRKLFWNTE